MTVTIPPVTESSVAPTQSTRLNQPVWMVWGIFTVVAALVLTNVCRYPPFNDFSEWVYHAYVAKYLLTHDLPFAVLKTWPVPNSISELIMAALMFVFHPITAARIFLSAYLIFGSWLALKLSTLYGGANRGLLFVLLTGILVIPSPFVTGETNYQVGLLFLCAYMFLIAKRETYTVQSFFTDLLFAVVIFFCHAICLLIFVMFILMKAFERKTLLFTCLSLIPAGLLSLTYLHFNTRNENTEGELSIPLRGLADLIAYRFYTWSKLGPYGNMILGNSGDFERARLVYFSGVAINVIFGLLLVAIVGTWLYSQLRKKWWAPEVLVAVFCLCLCLWNPTKLLRVATIGERFLLPAVVAAILGSASTRLSRAAAFFSATLCVFLLYWIVILPQGPFSFKMGNDAISQGSNRTKFLYWHKPFVFSQSAEAAQQSDVTHQPPELHLAFQTSLVTNKK